MSREANAALDTLTSHPDRVTMFEPTPTKMGSTVRFAGPEGRLS
jgi:hypothetical protein